MRVGPDWWIVLAVVVWVALLVVVTAIWIRSEW